jgi:hypothetical protein
MGNNRITGLADGIAATDAASVTQVTSAVAITGGTIDGTTIGTTTRSSVKATTLDLGLSTQSVAIGQGNASSIKNRIINGAMVIDQRNAGASVTPTVDNTYTLDRFKARLTQASKFSVQQDAGAVTPPTGFTDYLGVTSLSAYSVLAGDYFGIQQDIEGYNIADLGWGTANAKTVTLSFWVRSSLTGSFGGFFSNSASNRFYPYSYTISAANTWEQKSVTIAGDTSGTWLTTNGVGMQVFFSLGCGSTFSGTANAWTSSVILQPTGSTSVVGTNGATFYVTGVQLEVGSSATGFEYRQYTTELTLCQRYYEQTVLGNMQIPNGSGSAMINPISFHVTKRVQPTMATITAATLDGAGSTGLNGVSVDGFGLQFVNNSATNNFFTNSPVYSASAEL